MANSLTLTDGRNLQYLVSGAQDGFPLVWHHGTPGAYVALQSFAIACEKKGFQLISFSRAGWGDSSRRKGRRVVDDADDVRELLQHLGHEKCAAIGWSGGGPHALACAAKLDGCIAAITVASVAPSDGAGLDFFALQSPSSKAIPHTDPLFISDDSFKDMAEYEASLKGEDALRAHCEPIRLQMLEACIAEELAAMPEVDRKALQEAPGLEEFVEQSFQEGFKHGVDGWVDDDFAFYSPWGFDVTKIDKPVFIYQGSHDTSVPYVHGQWLAANINQQSVRRHLEEGEGHVSIMLAYTDQMLEELGALLT